MARLYTEKDIAKVLRDLRIAPVDGKVTGSEAAAILSWRAKDEFKIDHEYTTESVRQNIRKYAKKGAELPVAIDPTNSRRNLYEVGFIFTLGIAPRRAHNKKVEGNTSEDRIVA